MARLSDRNVELAREIIGRYPVRKSATIPLCHLAQEQDGHLADDAMAHIAELVDVTRAEVLGTASFYEMFKRQPVGRFVVNVCTSISCFLNGGDELLHHAEQRLGVKAGGTTADGKFTLEEYECIAACTEAPCLQVNYRYFHKVANDEFDRLIDDLGGGRLDESVPPHGVLQRVRQHVPADRAAGVSPPDGGAQPVWWRDEPALRTDGEPAAVVDPEPTPEPKPEAVAEAVEAIPDDMSEGVPEPRPADEPASAVDAAESPRVEGEAETADAKPSDGEAVDATETPPPAKRSRNRRRRPKGGPPSE